MSPAGSRHGTPARAPGTDASQAVPRNGSGAATAFEAMVKKRQGEPGDEPPPQDPPTQGEKPIEK